MDFLASDKALSSFANTENKGRPDILFVLENQLAFTRSSNSDTPIFVVEFKRPSKSSYRTSSQQEWDKEDSFDRFLDYKDSLQSGIKNTKSSDGRFVKLPIHKPIHFFLIADMTENLDKNAERA